MRFRLRFKKGPIIGQTRRSRSLAFGAAGLLTPAAAIAAVLGFWRLAADLDFAGTFAISSGVFSHWQVWLGAAILLQLCSRVLNRYAKGAGRTAP